MQVKVVLAAAMWNNPHILVLDEPTNYLDRESLGALAGAIRGYGGGCLMISHNRGKPSIACMPSAVAFHTDLGALLLQNIVVQASFAVAAVCM